MSHPPWFDHLVASFRASLAALPDSRNPSNNTKYEMIDAALSAFSVFFTQTPSFLAQQRALHQQQGRHNLLSLFGVPQIPCDNQIRNLLDPVPVESLFPAFAEVRAVLAETGHLARWQGWQGQFFIALDGVRYFCSQAIHCDKCNTRQLKNGVTEYFHQAVTPTLVCPGESLVLPLEPALVMPQDGHEKQDCENAAAKRWLRAHGAEWAARGATLLGDDLYGHQPLCEIALEENLNFIFNCREESHRTLYEWLAGVELEEVERVVVERGRKRVERYRYLNGVPVRDGADALLVNWCDYEERDASGRVAYYNAWVTNWELTPASVVSVAQAGRSRWKIENENNNTLKTKGYQFERNFGHGKENLAGVLATLNILAYVWHTVLELVDADYRAVRVLVGPRATFFGDVRTLLKYMYWGSWKELMGFMRKELESGLRSGRAAPT